MVHVCNLELFCNGASSFPGIIRVHLTFKLAKVKFLCVRLLPGGAPVFPSFPASRGGAVRTYTRGRQPLGNEQRPPPGAQEPYRKAPWMRVTGRRICRAKCSLASPRRRRRRPRRDGEAGRRTQQPETNFAVAEEENARRKKKRRVKVLRQIRNAA